MKNGEVRFNLDGLEKFKKSLKDTYVARVGILGSDVARTGIGAISNSEIGLIQMFGTLDGKIPPRDFLVTPIQKYKREILQGMANSKAKEALESGDFKRVFQLLGAKAEEYVQKAFETAGFGQWAPNAPSTIAAKGSSAPLINTGQLRRAVSSDVAKKSEVKGAVANL